MYRRIAVVACLTLLLAACGKTPDELAHDQAVRQAESTAAEAGARPLGNYDWQADRIAHDVAQVAGVEVMRVTGTSKNDRGGVIVVIRVHGSSSTEKYGKPGTVEVSVCFRLPYRGARGDGTPEGADCPPGAPLSIAKDPTLPSDIADTVLAILSVSPPPTEEAVRRAIDQLPLDPGVQGSVATVGTTIGVALRASQYDCLFGRLAGGKAKVWRPPHDRLAPGETSCTAAAATSSENG